MRRAALALLGVVIVVGALVLGLGRQPKRPLSPAAAGAEPPHTATSDEKAQLPAPSGGDGSRPPNSATSAGPTRSPSADSPAKAASTPSRAPQNVDERAKAILAAEMAHQRGEPAGDHRSVERLLGTYSTEELDLVASLNRAGISSPPELKGLFELRRRGGSPDDQKRYVRANLRGDASLRLMTLKWVDDHDPRSSPDRPLPPPAPGSGPALGSVEQVSPAPLQRK